MSGKLNWWRQGKVYGRKTLDYRYELDVPDRADKWLRAVERNQRERRQPRVTTTASSSVD
jgi:hypothetical protein